MDKCCRFIAVSFDIKCQTVVNLHQYELSRICLIFFPCISRVIRSDKEIKDILSLISGRTSRVSRTKKVRDTDEIPSSTDVKKTTRAGGQTSRQISAATESSTSDGRRKTRDEARIIKPSLTLRTQASSSTISSSKFISREPNGNRITINGQTYEKVCYDEYS